MGGRSIGINGKPPEEYPQPDAPPPVELPEFEWWEPKRQSTLEERGLDFEDAKQIWDGRPKLVIDTTKDTELRQINISKIEEKVYTVITTDRITQDGRDVIRIISFHRSDDRGVRLYEQFIKENLR